ncbi:hypothetical protein [Streptomyces sp. NPDC097610]|uniref:hypothetical protein n=1 Tax=Streptomyces sp. NPDC097610 TaxID=3157227 RepID=UPI0033231FD9
MTVCDPTERTTTTSTTPGEGPSNGHGDSPRATPAADAYREKLLEASGVLTAAARLVRPRLQRTDDGDWIDDLMGATDQADWAELVTLALAGAAANFGGVEAILAGRSGSWEAEGIRQLLHSTVGPAENALWEHRTEPLEITLHVDELLA